MATACGEETWSISCERMDKKRVRALTRRSGGRSLQQAVDRLRIYLLGWKNYFGLAQTSGVWQNLDEWIRHRLRCIQLKQRKRGKTIHRELLALGAPGWLAQKVAANSRRWWRNSGKSLNGVLTISWFDQLGLPVWHDLNFSNRPVRTRMPGGVGGGGLPRGCPLSRFTRSHSI